MTRPASARRSTTPPARSAAPSAWPSSAASTRRSTPARSGVAPRRAAPARHRPGTEATGIDRRRARAVAGQVGGPTGRAIAAAAREAFVAGMHHGVIVGAVVAMVGARDRPRLPAGPGTRGGRRGRRARRAERVRPGRRRTGLSSRRCRRGSRQTRPAFASRTKRRRALVDRHLHRRPSTAAPVRTVRAPRSRRRRGHPGGRDRRAGAVGFDELTIEGWRRAPASARPRSTAAGRPRPSWSSTPSVRSSPRWCTPTPARCGRTSSSCSSPASAGHDESRRRRGCWPGCAWSCSATPRWATCTASGSRRRRRQVMIGILTARHRAGRAPRRHRHRGRDRPAGRSAVLPPAHRGAVASTGPTSSGSSTRSWSV